MRTLKPLHRPDHGAAAPEFEDEEDDFHDNGEERADEVEGDLVRVLCPDCARPIALAGPGEALPQHALCPTPWDPFGLTVCSGSGRVVTDDGASAVPVVPLGAESGTLAALPEGLDWRLQPFSHATGPGTALRQAA